MNVTEVNYWTQFYSTFKNVIPSDFAKFVTSFFKELSLENTHLLDVGCGTGRDSYFLTQKFDVTGIDSSFKPENKTRAKFILGDMIDFDKKQYGVIYSRFTFHSITNEAHVKLLQSIHKNTYLCIETRSTKGIDLKRYYGDDHYRNFTDIDYLQELLKKHGFHILYLKESTGFSPHKMCDPICIRTICKKL